MTYDSITNRGDYLSPYYLAEKLPAAIKEKGGLRTRWAERDKAVALDETLPPTPVKALRSLRRDYFDARVVLTDESEDADLKGKTIAELNGSVLAALGFRVADPVTVLTVERAGESHEIPVAYAGPNVVALSCAWATDSDAAMDQEAGGRLLEPAVLGTSEVIETGAKLARWLFAAELVGLGESARYVLLVHGGVVVLADRLTWGEGRYLAVSLDVALERGDAAELETVAALFSADALQPPAEGGAEALAQFVDGSRQHAVGVSSELREGLRESVQIIANEVLDRLRAQELSLADLDATARDLGRESLRYLYRILFLLYAEARPELGILPADDDDYIEGYSMARLGELVTRRLGGEEARQGLHLYSSLDLLFRMVNNGHRSRGAATLAEDASEEEGMRFEALKADLFDPKRTHLIGRTADFDTRLRDAALYQVLRRLMLAKGKGRGSGRRGRTERGGFISYAQLGINQLGAVYEGLMSYTGFIATEELYEVAKGGDPSGGSWMIPASRADGYADDVFVMAVDDNGIKTGERVRYKAGSFVYRLAGRDRQTSASYYTPQSLTSVTVQLALTQREKEEGRTVSAAEVLRWRVCEPALGSGAFLNEAIDQIAALYMRKREEEPGVDRLEPDERAQALQRVKAYIALHNCYGVDLNSTAVELAEVSIWLNVMHRGLQAPWFGLHLVRGNSLIGCGRRLYPVTSMADKSWLKTAPVDHPFSAGTALLPGHIHHFLLPATGWGAVASEKEAKQLAPDETAALAAWRKKIQATPSAKRTAGHKLSQVQRLQALAGRAEYLWHLVVERLHISEREISRAIDVWGADGLPQAVETIPRDQIVSDLESPGTPYWRLKTLMDAWCALWFWPVGKASLLDGSDEAYKVADSSLEAAVAAVVTEHAPVDPDPVFPQVWEKIDLFGEELPAQPVLTSAAPKKPAKPKVRVDRTRPVALRNLDDWLDFAEALLGRQDIAGLAPKYENLSQLTDHEDQLHDEAHMNMDSWTTMHERFPWLDTVEKIAEDQGFFHWELRFASVFAEGGFDLQVGNPPWVRPEWEENPVLAELDPWFELVEKPEASERNRRIAKLISDPNMRGWFLAERAEQAGVSEFLGTPATYPLLVGTRPDFYRAFMIRTWSNIGSVGVGGLLHPDTHFVGDREKLLRSEAYFRLRIHGDFTNPGNRFFPPPVDRHTHFGLHIYGGRREIRFYHLSWLLSADELPRSLDLADSGQLPEGWGEEAGAPGIRYHGEWDARAHPTRVVEVNRSVLASWQVLAEEEGQPVEHTKLLNPLTIYEQEAIVALGRVRDRLGMLDPQISSGFNETYSVRDGIIRHAVVAPADWSEVILKGAQIAISTPYFKQPPETGVKGRAPDLVTLAKDAVPRGDYARSADSETYRQAQDVWIDPDGLGRPYSEFYRTVWRRMIPDNTERSLYPAIIPPGPTYISSMNGIFLRGNRHTALLAGFWSGLPIDYLLRIIGIADLWAATAKAMPAPALDHQLADPLLLRTLRLNCLTAAYADLWTELYKNSWRDEGWVVDWPNMAPLGDVDPNWEHATSLRTEYERRAALVEIDALVAAWLGITQEQLEAIYPARFPVLGDYEAVTWFDANGRKLAGNWNTFGTGQTKEHWEQFQRYQEDPAKNPVPVGYTTPFYKADRIAEYRQAHAAFAARLRQA